MRETDKQKRDAEKKKAREGRLLVAG